jgi:hypothetical protein
MIVRPTTLADYKAGNNLPPQPFSHRDQKPPWQSGVPNQPFETGWGGPARRHPRFAKPNLGFL